MQPVFLHWDSWHLCAAEAKWVRGEVLLHEMCLEGSCVWSFRLGPVSGTRARDSLCSVSWWLQKSSSCLMGHLPWVQGLGLKLAQQTGNCFALPLFGLWGGWPGEVSAWLRSARFYLLTSGRAAGSSLRYFRHKNSWFQALVYTYIGKLSFLNEGKSSLKLI